MSPTLAPVSRVGIVAKSNLRAAVPHLVAIAEWLAEHGAAAIFESRTAALLPSADGRRILDTDDLAAGVDLVLVLGGDGTLLGMADRIGEVGSGIPILGVNFGGLGFLTEVTLPELYPSLQAVLAGNASIEERLMIMSSLVRDGVPSRRALALNDAVITRGARARMVDLSVWVDDEFVTRVRADGLIIATPTGSTAYTLAANGPIVQPIVDALLITPIAPHTLTNRPLVVPGTATIRVQPQIEDRDEAFVTFDGQATERLQPGDEITVSRATRPLRLVRSSTRSYFEVLRTKLKWGEH
jgi:NAD+ kinase